ncbi:MAG TPA: glycine cleavage system aminomethyltransferase GcvT [Acidimicrobiales bacterium]|nr:glycine cleavage system aminomethyltransferase GcvT [Acidimicrobiales bacterium]
MTPPTSTPSSTSAPPPDASPEGLRHSPLEDCHRALDAKLVGFGGWLMPLAYTSGTLAEHRACRSAAVAFDVSHLGTVRVEGTGALEILQGQLTNDLRKIAPGRAQYTHLLDPDDASVVDDIIVWWIADDVFDVMPNASNTARVRDAVGGRDTTADRAVIAVQGPDARPRLASVAPEAAAVARFAVATFTWRGAPCTVAGTGYTGEDGVECAVPAAVAPSFWQALLDEGVVPAGLGARDTLRLEAGLPLHGQDLGPGITPLQAGLGWVVGWDKGEFRGRGPLARERETGPARRLRGLVADGRQPPRHDDAVLRGGARVGTVTSGNFSPVLERGIALALIDTGGAAADVVDGDELVLDVRGRLLPARIRALPFVQAGKRTDPVGGGR